MYKRVLLLTQLYPAAYNTSRYPSPGLGYIAQALGEEDIEHDVLDMGLGYNARDLVKKIMEYRPDLIGISMRTMMYKKQYELFSRIKTLPIDFDIVVGGPHISFLREKVLEDCKAIDFGIVGEGESAIVELCKVRRFDEIKGLIWRGGEEVIYNGDREFIKDLDAIPFPKYERFQLKKYPVKMIGIASSRGCPYSCIFCGEPLIVGKEFRGRSAKNVVDELKYWYSQGYTVFDFADSNSTFDMDRIYDICEEIDKNNLKGINLSVGNGVRADKTDKSLLKRMREVGFKQISFGVEGGNNKMMKILKKGETIEQIKEAIRNACDLGFDVFLFFQVGSPGETYSDIKDSITLALKYPICMVEFYNQIPIPGTEVFDIVKRNNYFLVSPEVYLNDPLEAHSRIPFFETTQLKAKSRKKILKETKKVQEIIYRKYFLRHWKKKYGVYLSNTFGRLFVAAHASFQYNRCKMDLLKLKSLRLLERTIDRIKRCKKVFLREI